MNGLEYLSSLLEIEDGIHRIGNLDDGNKKEEICERYSGLEGVIRKLSSMDINKDDKNALIELASNYMEKMEGSKDKGESLAYFIFPFLAGVFVGSGYTAVPKYIENIISDTTDKVSSKILESFMRIGNVNGEIYKTVSESNNS